MVSYKALYTKVVNSIKQAYLSKVDKDSGPYPIGQLTANGKATTFTRLSVYGVCSNPPKDSHVLVFNVQGQESVKFGIANDFLARLKDLKEGESALYNTKTESAILMKADGTIEITNAKTVDIIGGDITADGVSMKEHTHEFTWTSGGGTSQTKAPTVTP